MGADPAWQESFYFNWADPERRSFTLARTGYRFPLDNGFVFRDGALHAIERVRIRQRADRLAPTLKALRR